MQRKTRWSLTSIHRTAKWVDSLASLLFFVGRAMSSVLIMERGWSHDLIHDYAS